MGEGWNNFSGGLIDGPLASANRRDDLGQVLRNHRLSVVARINCLDRAAAIALCLVAHSQLSTTWGITVQVRSIDRED